MSNDEYDIEAMVSVMAPVGFRLHVRLTPQQMAEALAGGPVEADYDAHSSMLAVDWPDPADDDDLEAIDAAFVDSIREAMAKDPELARLVAEAGEVDDE